MTFWANYPSPTPKTWKSAEGYFIAECPLCGEYWISQSDYPVNRVRSHHFHDHVYVEPNDVNNIFSERPKECTTI